ncbi:MAG: hypothetical protein FVQ78_10340 [Solirubrobacterales bacterium]|nr:hypothetical protein [Solirubrobacterales bacterium]
MPQRDPAELAARLARKARADATAARKFAADSEIVDEIGDWVETQPSEAVERGGSAEGGEKVS